MMRLTGRIGRIGPIGWMRVIGLIVVPAVMAQSPNILLIVSEDNGPDLGCYGNPWVKTPNLDRLAAEGVRFERAFVPQAGCSQSRAAFLTGLYPHVNGQIGLATWKFRMYREDTPNVVRSLKGAGYRTGILGKLHVNPESAFPFDFKVITGSNFGRKKLGAYAEEAGEFMAASQKPFFLSVNYPDAHRPFLAQVNGIPAKPLRAADVGPLPHVALDSPTLRQETADYLNSMMRLDALIGDLLRVLDETGKADDTLVVYIGDHGADQWRGKRTCYEGGVRVPMILRWPNRIEGGQVCRELVSTLDLMPTFLEAVGAAGPGVLSGRSLVPLLDDPSVEWRRYLFTEFHTHSAHNYFPQRAVRDERFKLIRNLMPGEVNPDYDFIAGKYYADHENTVASAPDPVRSAYLRMRQPPEYELYDLEADPQEWTNLADDPAQAEALARLKEALAEWRERTKDPLLQPENVRRLKGEIEACFEVGKPSKGRLELTYPDYFFK